MTPDLINKGTPIEDIGRGVFVKREDLCCLPPGPPFAKVRGLYVRLQKLKDEGYKTFGYMDTTISMAGCGVSYFCRHMGLNSIIYHPLYKDGREPHNMPVHKRIWAENGAEIVGIPATRLVINQHKAKKDLLTRYPDNSILLPNGLPLHETVREVAAEVPKNFPYKTVVMCIGSGVMAAGVLRGLQDSKISDVDIFGILVSTRDPRRLKRNILAYSQLSDSGIMWRITNTLKILSAGFEYEEKVVDHPPPFPCNSYYDMKAWAWLTAHKSGLKKPILFWNIGGEIETTS